MSKQQKTTERYLAKRQMLMTRKDECNSNIRDLGVLPEEAFEKYVNEKLERVQLAILYAAFPLLNIILIWRAKKKGSMLGSLPCCLLSLA